MRAKTYDLIDDDLIDDDLIATMLLVGPGVLHDNQQFYNHLKGWMQDGPAWSFMQASTTTGKAVVRVPCHEDPGKGLGCPDVPEGQGICVSCFWHAIYW
jgi:hypothetical protein